MRPSLFASSVSNVPLCPAGVAGGVFEPSAASPASGISMSTVGSSLFTGVSLVPETSPPYTAPLTTNHRAEFADGEAQRSPTPMSAHSGGAARRLLARCTDGRVLVRARRIPAGGHCLAGSVSRSAPGEPGDDLPARGLPAGP